MQRRRCDGSWDVGDRGIPYDLAVILILDYHFGVIVEGYVIPDERDRGERATLMQGSRRHAAGGHIDGVS